MADNDPIVGAMLHGIESMIKRLDWRVEPASDDAKAIEAAEFLESCMSDMSVTWEDFISETMSMLIYGWAYFEVLWKLRSGYHGNTKRTSKHDDKRIGWRKFAIRGQETLQRWEFDDDGGIQGMWQLGPPDYTERYIPISKSMLFRTTTKRNNPEGRSILRNSYRPYYFLKKIQEIEAIGIERDLAGLPVMKVPQELMHSGANAAQQSLRADLEELVSQIRKDERAGVLIPHDKDSDGNPSGYELDLLTTGGSRQIDTDVVIKRYESRIAMSTLMEFILLGTDSGSSESLINGKVKLFAMSLGGFVGTIKSIVNRFAVEPLFALNPEFPKETWATVTHSEIDAPQLEEISNYLNRLVMAGLITPDNTLESTLRAKAKLPPREEGFAEERELDFDSDNLTPGEKEPALEGDEYAQEK